MSRSRLNKVRLAALAESRNLSKYLKTIAILLQVHQLIHSSPHVGLVSFIFTVCKTKTFLSALLSLYFLCSCWVLSEGHIPASYVSVKVVQSISFKGIQSISFKEDQSISVKGVQSFSVKGVWSISFRGVQSISSNIPETQKNWGWESTSFYQMILTVLQICGNGVDLH